jgi:hypothetical protein
VTRNHIGGKIANSKIEAMITSKEEIIEEIGVIEAMAEAGEVMIGEMIMIVAIEMKNNQDKHSPVIQTRTIENTI